MVEVKKPSVRKTTKAAPKAVKKTTSKAEKPVIKKTVPKSEVNKKPVQVEVAVTTARAKKPVASVSADVINLEGKATGKIALPGELFGEKINKALLAQAIRVYLANQRQGNASTKTRGEVDGSTRKIYRQKGTGRARHGSLRAPIFVKGGIVFGPKPRDFSLTLPQKMKRKALAVALSAKLRDKELIILDGMDGIKPKTKVFAAMMKNIAVIEKKINVLFVTTANAAPILRAGRNIPGVHFVSVQLLHTYALLTAKKVVVMKDAIDEIKERFVTK